MAGTTYAGFWIRFAAWLIDLIAIGFIRFAVTVFLAPFMGWVFGLFAGWIYYALFESSEWQATPGKYVLGMQVTDLEGRRINFGRASGRFYAKILSTLLLGIGYFIQPFTARRQALHDMLASCLVIERPR